MGSCWLPCRLVRFDPWFVVTVINYALGQWLARRTQGRGAVLSLGLAVNVGALLHFKLADFYVPALLTRLAAAGLPALPALQVLVPIGLSYYTLQAISFLVDTYRRPAVGAVGLVDFALTWPTSLSLLLDPWTPWPPSWRTVPAPRVVDNAALARSAGLIVVGLVRKMVLADRQFVLLPANAFSAPERYPGLELWFYLVAYALALYNDFAGYTSIARGISGFFGLEVSPRIFNGPTSRVRSVSFGRAGTSRCRPGCATTCSSPLAVSCCGAFPRVITGSTGAAPAGDHAGQRPLARHRRAAADFIWGLLHGLFLIGERLVLLRRPVVSPDHGRGRSKCGARWLFLCWSCWPGRPSIAPPTSFRCWRFGVGCCVLGLVRGPAASGAGGDLGAVPLLVRLGCRPGPSAGGGYLLRWPLLARSATVAVALLAIFLSVQPAGAIPFVYQGF